MLRRDAVGVVAVVMKACGICCVESGSCRGVAGPVEKIGPAKEMLLSSWPPKNPDIIW